MKPKRLALEHVYDPSLTYTLYTVPAGTTVLLKNVTATSVAGEFDSMPNLQLYLVPAGETLDRQRHLLLCDGFQRLYGSVLDWEGQHVLIEGDSLLATGYLSNVLISGVELDMAW